MAMIDVLFEQLSCKAVEGPTVVKPSTAVASTSSGCGGPHRPWHHVLTTHWHSWKTQLPGAEDPTEWQVGHIPYLSRV